MGAKFKMTGYEVKHFYQRPALSEGRRREKLSKLRTVNANVIALDTEFCYNLECNGENNETHTNTPMKTNALAS